MNLSALTRPLDISEIDFRVQSISGKGYATILAYKDARTDMSRLDEAFGPHGWQRDYKLIDGKLFCGVSIYHDASNQWIWKWDVGTESMTEKEKGQASDAFKRACFNLGIGRELYEYPFISIQLRDNEWTKEGSRGKQTWDLKIRDWKWYSEFTDGKITFLAAKDENGKLRFKWGEMKPKQEEPEYKSSASTEEAHPSEPSPIDDNQDANPAGVLKKKSEPIVDEERERAIVEYKAVYGKAPHGRMSTDSIINAVQEQLMKIEADEEEEQEDNSSAVYEDKEHLDFITTGWLTLDDYINQIHTYDDPKEFGNWARGVVTRLIETESEERLEEFKDLCNEHYKKIAK